MPQLDETARLAPRCPNCGQRVRAEMTVCSACGAELLPRRARMRCKRCGSRIPADATVCPRCQGNPRAARVSVLLARGAAMLFGVLALICLGGLFVRALTMNFFQVFNSPVPTSGRATIIYVIQVVASPIPSPVSVTPSPFPPGRVSPTPSRRGARPATPSVTATPTLPPGFYPTPQLLAPAHMTVYSGTNASILLEWLPVTAGTLRENEWYEVRLMYTARAHTPGEYRHYTKETRWRVRTEWHNDLAEDARQVQWLVTVVRVEGFDPFAASVRTPVSLPSAMRVFVWQ